MLLGVLSERADIAIKWRFFRHLINGGDPDSARVYRWHIETRTGGIEKRSWKKTVDDYVLAAGALAFSMQAGGFDPSQPVVICPKGKLRDGAHRISCALATGSLIRFERHNQPSRARPWCSQYLKDAGIMPGDLERVLQDWKRLKDEASADHHAA
jgi:hypothetical protein